MGRKQARRHNNKLTLHTGAAKSLDYSSVIAASSPQPQRPRETSLEVALKAVYTHCLNQIPEILFRPGTVHSAYVTFFSTNPAPNSLEPKNAERIYSENLGWFTEKLLEITTKQPVTKELLYRLYRCFSIATGEAHCIVLGATPSDPLNSLHEPTFVEHFIEPVLLRHREDFSEFEDGRDFYQRFIIPRQHEEELKLDNMSIDEIVRFINGSTVKRRKQKLKEEFPEVDVEIEEFKTKLEACEPELNRLKPMVSQEYLEQLRGELLIR